MRGAERNGAGRHAELGARARVPGKADRQTGRRPDGRVDAARVHGKAGRQTDKPTGGRVDAARVLSLLRRRCADARVARAPPARPAQKVASPLAELHPFYLLLETSGSNEAHDEEKINEYLEAMMGEGEAGARLSWPTTQLRSTASRARRVDDVTDLNVHAETASAGLRRRSNACIPQHACMFMCRDSERWRAGN